MTLITFLKNWYNIGTFPRIRNGSGVEISIENNGERTCNGIRTVFKTRGEMLSGLQAELTSKLERTLILITCSHVKEGSGIGFTLHAHTGGLKGTLCEGVKTEAK